MEFSRPAYWSGSLSLLQGVFPTQGSNPGLPHGRWIFLPAEPKGKPKKTGVGCLSLLQQISPTQESNQGFLLCRQILYQLSYEGSPGRWEALAHIWLWLYPLYLWPHLPPAHPEGRRALCSLQVQHGDPPPQGTPSRLGEGTVSPTFTETEKVLKNLRRPRNLFPMKGQEKIPEKNK